jgi:hypothetical protein
VVGLKAPPNKGVTFVRVRLMIFPDTGLPQNAAASERDRLATGGRRVIGSTIIAEKDPSRLAKITSIDDLEHFVCIELDTMATLDFQTIVVDGGVKWAQDKPIQYDPESGVAIFKIDEMGLAYVLERAKELDKAMQADLCKLAFFVSVHGGSSLYEFATF